MRYLVLSLTLLVLLTGCAAARPAGPVEYESPLRPIDLEQNQTVC